MNVVRVTPNQGTSTVPGPVLFARYAFPPNSHGYCGPGDHESFFSYGVAGADDRGLRELARQFAGAWPYLELIAAATGLSDPLDARVVEAYWVGSPRLEGVSTRAVGNSMEERFRRTTGAKFRDADHQRAGWWRTAPQFRGVLHLSLDRSAERRTQGRERADGLGSMPHSLGTGAGGHRGPGRRRVPPADLGRSPTRSRRAHHLSPWCGPSTG